MEKKTSKPAQITVVLRLIAGVYLLYLSFGLGKEIFASSGGRQLMQLGFAVIFLLVGAALSIWSVRKLVRGEFLRPGDDGEEDASAGEAGAENGGEDVKAGEAGAENGSEDEDAKAN